MATDKNANKKERHILALSGGKDSAALAVYMRDQHPELDMEYVFTDSGCELPETYEYLDRIRAVLNIDITVVKSERDWDSYWSLWKTKLTQHGHYTYLPSPKQRWCTEVLKLIPYETWLLDNYPNTIIHSYVGLRADEKRDRSGFTAMKGNVIQHHPFVEDGLVLEDIERLLIDSGLGFPAYYKWRTRSGCYFCFYQTKREWLGLYENHPDLYKKAMSYETIIPEKGIKYTWIEDMSLKELLALRQSIIKEHLTGDGSEKTPNKLSTVLADII
jgi:hypothetical protein